MKSLHVAGGLILYLTANHAIPATYTDTFVPGLSMIANHVNTGGNTLMDIFGTSLPGDIAGKPIFAPGSA